MKQSPNCSPKILVYIGWFIGFLALIAMAVALVFLVLVTFVR